MAESIRFHGAVLRSTYVDCQYSTVRICDYVVPVTLLKFLLSSRICGSSCCSTIKHYLSKFDYDVNKKLMRLRFVKDLHVSVANFSRNSTTDPTPRCYVGVRSHVRITEKYKTSLSEYAVVATAVNTCSLQYVILFPGPSSRTRKSRDIQVNSSAGNQLDMSHYFVYANSVILVPWFILIFNRLRISC